MDPKIFKKINELLARLIYAPDTSEAMRKAAKDARQSLHRLFGKNNYQVRRKIMRAASAKQMQND